MKLTVIASGWHFPAQFYEAMARQVTPKGWEVKLYCVAHRDPSHAIEEKKDDSFDDSLRGKLDKVLYSRVISKEDIQMLGWNYKEYPNTIGDWGNANQWLEENDYKDSDLILVTHDDNLVIHDRLFVDTVEDEAFKDWDILTNSPGQPYGSLRGSFEFFKSHVIEKIGGKFDLSTISLTREGHTKATDDLEELYDWNNIITPMANSIIEHGFKVATLSPCYRVSAYVIEGERGYISKTHGENTVIEDAGLKYLEDNKII